MLCLFSLLQWVYVLLFDNCLRYFHHEIDGNLHRFVIRIDIMRPQYILYKYMIYIQLYIYIIRRKEGGWREEVREGGGEGLGGM